MNREDGKFILTPQKKEIVQKMKEIRNYCSESGSKIIQGKGRKAGRMNENEKHKSPDRNEENSPKSTNAEIEEA